MIKVVLYSECPESERPIGIPLDWPWRCVEIKSGQDHSAIPGILMSLSEYATYRSERLPAYQAWEDNYWATIEQQRLEDKERTEWEYYQYLKNKYGS